MNASLLLETAIPLTPDPSPKAEGRIRQTQTFWSPAPIRRKLSLETLESHPP
jgi:hypothetical protein